MRRPSSPADYGGSVGDFPSLSGFVFIDSGNNGIKSSGDWAVGNVVVKLLEASNPSFSLSYTTGANGFYTFGDLAPGVYTVEAPLLSQIFQSGRGEMGGFVNSSGEYYAYPGSGSSDPPLQASDYGTIGTCSGMCMASNITIQEGFGAVDYNFLEGALLADQVSKRLFLASAGSGSTSGGPTYWVNGGPVPVVPEPGTLALLGAGGIAAALVVWRRKAVRRRGKQQRGDA